MSQMCLGASKFLTLYISISMSCRRLFTKLGSFHFDQRAQGFYPQT